MPVKKTCILKHVKTKTKANLPISFDLVSKAWQQHASEIKINIYIIYIIYNICIYVTLYVNVYIYILYIYIYIYIYIYSIYMYICDFGSNI